MCFIWLNFPLFLKKDLLDAQTAIAEAIMTHSDKLHEDAERSRASVEGLRRFYAKLLGQSVRLSSTVTQESSISSTTLTWKRSPYSIPPTFGSERPFKEIGKIMNNGWTVLLVVSTQDPCSRCVVVLHWSSKILPTSFAISQYPVLLTWKQNWREKRAFATPSFQSWGSSVVSRPSWTLWVRYHPMGWSTSGVCNMCLTTPLNGSWQSSIISVPQVVN